MSRPLRPAWQGCIHEVLHGANSTEKNFLSKPFPLVNAYFNVMWQPGWEESLGRMDTCICMPESLCCPLETITILLISYTPNIK